MKRRLLLLAWLAGLATARAAPAQLPERGVGPFTLRTAQAGFPCRLLRREGDLVWLLRTMPDGRQIETGLPKKDLVRLDMPRPKLFDLAAVAVTTQQMEGVRGALQKLGEALRPFRDLPGVMMDEGLLWQGRLLEKQARWREAALLYENIIQQPYDSPQANEALMRAGFCQLRMENYPEALERFEAAAIGEDDANLFSEYLFARARAHAAVGQHRLAILDWLYLVVFHPYVNNNEVRCLGAVLPSYIALKDWDAAYKTLQALREGFPGAPETQEAEDVLRPYEKEMENEALYQSKER